MKNTLLAALLALPLLASAQVVFGVSPGYDYDVATSNRAGLKSVAKTAVYGGALTKYGQFEAGLYEVEVRGERFSDSIQGSELGYSNGFQAGPVRVSGRVAVGQVRGRNAPSADVGYYSTYFVGVAVPVAERLAATASVRYRPERDLDQQQQYSVGLTYAASPKLSVSTHLRHTRSSAGPILNGAAVSAIYAF